MGAQPATVLYHAATARLLRLSERVADGDRWIVEEPDVVATGINNAGQITVDTPAAIYFLTPVE